MRKLTFPIILLILVSLYNSGHSQQNENGEEILWCFTRMVVVANAMISEAHQSKDFRFIELASKYLDYAQGNINKLIEARDSTHVEKAQEIVDFLDRISTAGVNPKPQDAVARAIVSNYITDFARSVFREKIDMKDPEVEKNE